MKKSVLRRCQTTVTWNKTAEFEYALRLPTKIVVPVTVIAAFAPILMPPSLLLLIHVHVR